MKRLVLLLTILALSIMVSGCGGIPRDMRQQAEGVSARISSAQDTIKSLESGFGKLKASKAFDFYRPYESREKWSGWFSDARKCVEGAKAADKNIKQLLERNNKDEISALYSQLGAVEEHLRNANAFAHKPGERMSFLAKVKKDAPKLVSTAKQELKQESLVFASLAQSVNQAASAYPGKKEDLSKRFAALKQCDKACRDAYTCASREVSSSNPDYAALGDGCVLVGSRLGWIREQDKQIRGKINELGRSYSKTLVDMKQDFFVRIMRTSWNESSDWDTDTDYNYPDIAVDEDTYDYFDTWADDVKLASYSSGYFSRGLSVYADQSMWDKLGINYMESWPGNGHDSAEYYVSDTVARGYHKYMIVENGKQTTTGWVGVSNLIFQKHINDLGMDIISKPYGVYEEETITAATPPGMAYVGNPRYGHWQGGLGGSNLWVWYGQYKFFEMILGRNRYAYNDWDNWNRNYRGRRPYYGKDKDEDRWGSGSQYARTRYAGSTWSRSGGFAREDDSVRGAGASARGGGPGGGGK